MGWYQSLRQRDPGASVVRLLWWELIRQFIWFTHCLLYTHRWWGQGNIPPEGPVMLVSNHQSYLDMTVIAMGIPHRHYHPMAEAHLFERPRFAWLIRTLNAFPVEQGKGDIAAIRLAIERLSQGHMLIIFPEGRRSADGMVRPFQPGVMTVIKRARPTIVPMAVEGTFDVWPRHRKLPRLRGYVAAAYGEPIRADTLLQMPPREAAMLLRDRVNDLRLDLRRKLRIRSRGRFPPSGPGDQ